MPSVSEAPPAASQPAAPSSVPASAPSGPTPSKRRRPRDPLRRRGRLPLLILTVIVGVAGIAGIVFFASRAGDAEGAGLSVVLALIPLPVLLLMYAWLDRYEPEPRRYKLAAFVWGAVIAVVISLALEIFIGDVLFDLSDEQMATFVAPPVEETAKGLFFLAIMLRSRRAIGGLIDGLFYAGLVGVGFAFVENIGYYAVSYLGIDGVPLAGADGATTTFVVRGIMSPFAHPLFLSSLGLAIGLAVLLRSAWLRVPLIAGGWVGSVILHGLWNGSASYGGPIGFVLMYLTLGTVLLGVVVAAVLLRSRQLRVLERSLSYMAQRGWIHPAEIPFLTRFPYRAAARRHARTEGGRPAARVVARYQRLATETAFLHDAVMLGRGGRRGVEQTAALLERMSELRPDLRLPPAIAPLPPRPGRPMSPAGSSVPARR